MSRLSRLLWLILLAAPALANPLRTHAGRPLRQAHPDLLDGASVPTCYSRDPAT